MNETAAAGGIFSCERIVPVLAVSDLASLPDPDCDVRWFASEPVPEEERPHGS